MKRKNFLILLSLLLLLAMIPFLNNDPYFLQIFIMIMLFAYWSESWNIVGGFAGQLSLGHSAFAAIGAYVSTILFNNYGLSPWLGMLVGGLISGIFGMLIGYPCFRLRGTYFTLATIAFLNVISIIVLANNTIFGINIRGAQGLSVPWRGNSLINMQFASKAPYFYLILFLLVVVTLVSYLIKRSKMGYYLAAIKIFEAVEKINRMGTSILLVEQNVLYALEIATKGYVMETGQMVISGPNRELLANEDLRKAYLGI